MNMPSILRRLAAIVGWHVTCSLGWFAVLLAGLLIAAQLYLQHVQVLEAQAVLATQAEYDQALQLQHQRQQRVMMVLPVAPMAAPVDAAEQAQAFVAAAPDSAALPEVLESISQLARKHGLMLNFGDYQWRQAATASPAEGLRVYDMRFVLHGDYHQHKKFMADVLNHFPTLAMTSLDLQRPEVGSAGVASTMVFSIYMKGRPPHG
ncbi:MAG TPA: type 4a pilus biogenesis protein PilO [Methylophilus sp.]